ncbi:TIM barrel protein [Acidaminobacter sp.]|uniref:TIM barrel protein n=1 Tax=Acidaminobacter sp. TaxID=1872102 RepID=UPI00256BDDC4|nr:TIM barrel protein [Acidaminobacter sp.]MDK9710754.1 sugar phosphate isomerase/epimerase [Acidaminobacter sp.]
MDRVIQSEFQNLSAEETGMSSVPQSPAKLGRSLGSNTNNADVETLAALGFTRIEVCLGRHRPYKDMLERIFLDLDTAKALGLDYTIHLPLCLYDWFPFDYLDGYYLDPDPEKRDLAFRFLEENLRQLTSRYQPDYYVIHFPGIYRNAYHDLDFHAILHEALGKLQSIAENFGTVLALEYFGSNKDFNRPEQWIEALNGYSRLAPLLDTGHLYFSCLMNGFDFNQVVETFGPYCLGFHVWTVRGNDYYGNSPFYKEFHHVIPHPGQQRSEGWAFDPASVYRQLKAFESPVVLEASSFYGGRDYYLEGLKYAADCYLGGACE